VAFKHKSIYSWLLLLLVLLAAILRFWDFNAWSLHNDELSTIFRAKYDSLKEVIEFGVMSDVHPWLNEVFMHYWIQLFGDSPFAVRLPYVLMSIRGVWYFHSFTRSISGKTAALLATSVVATSQIFVLYSQIARPYAMGFLIMMVFAYSWKRLLDENNWKWSLITGLMATLAAMTHYFLALSVLLLFVIGLFWILQKRALWTRYLSSGFFALILFSPHLAITIDQLSQKGLGWLSKPESDFFIDFIYFSLNESLIFILLILIAPLIAYRMGLFRWPTLKEASLSLVFIASFLIGYFYSVKVEPVIQKSTLIFSFPFLLILPFSFFKDENERREVSIFAGLTMALGLITLIFSANFYGPKAFADFEKVAGHLVNWKSNMGRDLSIISNSSNPKYLNYYYQLKGFELEEEMDSLYGREKIEEAAKIIRESRTENLALAFANANIPPDVYEYARIFYPFEHERNRYFNSEALLLAKVNKTQRSSANARSYSFMTRLSDRNHSDRWEVRPDLYEDSIYLTEPSAFRISENDLYSLTYRTKVKTVFRDGSNWLTLKARMKNPLKNGMHLAVSTERGSEHIDWRSVECDYYHVKGEWYWVTFVYQIPKEALPEDDLLVYFWNPKKGEALIDEVELINYEDSDFDYYQLP